MLVRCEVCPSWPSEKAYKHRAKPKVLKKPTLKNRADDRSPKNTKQVKVIFSCKKLIVEDRQMFVLA